MLRTVHQYVFPAIPGHRGILKLGASLAREVPSHHRLIHNFNPVPAVQRVVVSPLLEVTSPLGKRPINSCNICHRRFNSQSQAEAHYRGNKHARMAKGMESSKTTQEESRHIMTMYRSAKPATELNADTQDSTLTTIISTAEASSTDAETANSLFCQLCKVVVNSPSQLEAHNSGTKHKAMVDAQNSRGPIKAYLSQSSSHHTQRTPSGLHNKIFHCHLCDISVNSEAKLKQHISSRKHRDKVAGKIPKPKVSKHLLNVPAQMLLPVQREFLVETRVQPDPINGTLPFISRPLTPCPAAAPSIFQVPPLVHWLQQSPPGPVRISNGSLLFTPY